MVAFWRERFKLLKFVMRDGWYHPLVRFEEGVNGRMMTF